MFQWKQRLPKPPFPPQPLHRCRAQRQPHHLRLLKSHLLLSRLLLTTTSGIHPITVGLSISANNQVQPQPAPGTCHVGKAKNGQPLPDPNCTPGTTNPAVTQDNIGSTICRSGYTSDIRPSSSITGREKKANAASYSYTGDLGNAEYDHLISLELGGSPNDPKNLWVEPGGPNWKPADKFRNDKDAIENKLKSMICAHQVTLAAAQSAIANDWTTALETAKANS